MVQKLAALQDMFECACLCLLLFKLKTWTSMRFDLIPSDHDQHGKVRVRQWDCIPASQCWIMAVAIVKPFYVEHAFIMGSLMLSPRICRGASHV